MTKVRLNKNLRRCSNKYPALAPVEVELPSRTGTYRPNLRRVGIPGIIRERPDTIGVLKDRRRCRGKRFRRKLRDLAEQIGESAFRQNARVVEHVEQVGLHPALGSVRGIGGAQYPRFAHGVTNGVAVKDSGELGSFPHPIDMIMRVRSINGGGN